jgi:hypothetical protein
VVQNHCYAVRSRSYVVRSRSYAVRNRSYVVMPIFLEIRKFLKPGATHFGTCNAPAGGLLRHQFGKIGGGGEEALAGGRVVEADAVG